MRPWLRSAPGPYALMPPLQQTTIILPVGGAFMRPWPRSASWPYALMHQGGINAAPTADHHHSLRRGRIYAPLAEIGSRAIRINATRAALMPPLQQTITILPVGGAFMRPWPRSAPWPFLTREFQALKSRDGARLKAGSVIKISGLNGNKRRSSAARP